MRPEDRWLGDLRDAAAAVIAFLEGYSKAEFLQDPKTRSAVLQQLTVIGEAAARLPLEFRRAHPSVDWPSIIAFRNRAVHAYFKTDWNIVWDTAQRNVPSLVEQITHILDDEYPAEDAQE
ncbi:MAG: HepT-like ribonuclease domain-containing protein [Thermomicrobiales bacterium]